MNRVKRPVLRYHGGKWMLAPWLISCFPPHRVYVEPFAGAASVLMRKPRCYSEVINDLDGEIVTLFSILRDPAQSARLRELLLLTPFARDEFRKAYLPTKDVLEQSRRLIVRSFMGFGSAAHNSNHLTGFRSNSNRSGTTPAHDWMHYPSFLEQFTERLRGVVIENKNALEMIPQHDTPDTLFYIDPPYPHSTRQGIGENRANAAYRFEMTDDDHRALAAVLRSVRGKVVLSGYPCALYDLELYPDWYRVQRRHHADGARDRTEVLWLNVAAATETSQLRFEEESVHDRS